MPKTPPKAVGKPTKLSHSTRKLKPDLSVKEIRFARHWAEHQSGIEAAKHAGYQGEANSHYVTASRLLRKCKIRKYIRELQDQAAAAAQITFERIARELGRITFSTSTRVKPRDRTGAAKELNRMLGYVKNELVASAAGPSVVGIGGEADPEALTGG